MKATADLFADNTEETARRVFSAQKRSPTNENNN